MIRRKPRRRAPTRAIGDQVVGHSRRQVHLLERGPASGEDVGIGRVHEQARNRRRGVPHEVPCDLGTSVRDRGLRCPPPAAYLIDADLSGDNLSFVKVTGANLTGSDLVAANLTGSDLVAANLAGAVLTSTNLASAVLTGALLYDAVLTGANLTGANLTGAVLTNAVLTGALLHDAVLSGATWSDTTCPDGTISDNDGATCVGNLG